MASNKWVDLPSLNFPRSRPGSLVLQSRTAFCFCGSLGYGSFLNSVESLELAVEGKWSILAVNSEMKQTLHLTGASFKGAIVVFGGPPLETSSMCILSEEGDFKADLSHLGQIPNSMCSGSYIVDDNKIFAAGWTSS